MNYLLLGMNLLGAAGQYGADKARAKAEQAWQAYSNKMIELTSRQAQNTVTANELLMADAFTNQGFNIQSESIFARAKTEAAAAAAGVKGRSVDRTIREVLSTSARREAERQEMFRVGILNIGQQRRQIDLDAALQRNYSYIPKPNAASYMLNAVTNSM